MADRMASAATASIKLHIIDLDPTVNQADLNSVFKNFVSSIKSIKIRRNGSLSSANIEFSDPLAAESARRELNGELVKTIISLLPISIHRIRKSLLPLYM